MTADDPLLRLDGVGRTGPAFRFEVTTDAISAYAEATGETADAPLGGRVAPPVFAILPAREALVHASAEVCSPEALQQVVHHLQDFNLYRPIRPELVLVTQATPVGVLPRPGGTAVVIRSETRTEGGELMNEQYLTQFVRSIESPAGRGAPAPDHVFASASAPDAELEYLTDDDVTVRYADASGDRFAIHLDDAFARSVGLPGRIVHGLCTMAFAGRAVLEAAGIDDPEALGRLAVRFSGTFFPGEALTTRVWDSGGGCWRFDANAGGRTVLKDGLAVLC